MTRHRKIIKRLDRRWYKEKDVVLWTKDPELWVIKKINHVSPLLKSFHSDVTKNVPYTSIEIIGDVYDSYGTCEKCNLLERNGYRCRRVGLTTKRKCQGMVFGDRGLFHWTWSDGERCERKDGAGGISEE
jgi:hypothetical protein